MDFVQVVLKGCSDMVAIGRSINKILKLFGVRLIRLGDYKDPAIYGSINEKIIPEIKGLNVNFIYDRAIDERIRAKGVNSVLEHTLEEIIDKSRFKNKRVLEIGPKFGHHSLWIDKNLNPSYFLMLELPSKKDFSKNWFPGINCPHEIIFEDILVCKSLLKKAPFDLVFFTGVLYHNVEHIKMLHILWEIIHPKGMMVLQSTIYREEQSLIKLAWKPGKLGGYSYPSPKALLTMLAMTGWNNISVFPCYRPKGGVILLTSEKNESQPESYSRIPFGGSAL